MSATILPFPLPTFPIDRHAGLNPREREIALILDEGRSLLDNMDDLQAIDLWLVRVEKWEAEFAFSPACALL